MDNAVIVEALFLVAGPAANQLVGITPSTVITATGSPRPARRSNRRSALPRPPDVRSAALLRPRTQVPTDLPEVPVTEILTRCVDQRED